ncbi:Cell division cycle protein cdt2, partial [Tolypocladium capitatum]
HRLSKHLPSFRCCSSFTRHWFVSRNDIRYPSLRPLVTPPPSSTTPVIWPLAEPRLPPAGTMQPQGSSAANAAPPSPTAAESPPANPFLSPPRSSQHKEKRVPSVTPRRFRKFFTPRSFQSPGTRTMLGVMDSAAVDRELPSPQSLNGHPLDSDPICPSSPTERSGAMDIDTDKRKWEEQPGPAIKRRRGTLPDAALLPPLHLRMGNEDLTRRPAMDLPDGSAEDRESLRELRKATLSHFFKASRRGAQSFREKSLSSTQEHVPAESKSMVNSPSHGLPILSTHLTCLAKSLQGYRPQPIRKFCSRGFESHLLDREHGCSSHTGKQFLAFPAYDPRRETASFYSDSSDIHRCIQFQGQGSAIPFSLASCHGFPVTAIGDEQGFVRIFKTVKDEATEDKVATSIKIHGNAVMDLDFSKDDLRMASVCGDRSGKILDTVTESIAVELGDGHWDSLRQVAFQPGQHNGNVLATSDRAGRVQIWDLRCSSLPVQCFSADRYLAHRDTSLDPVAGRTVNTIDNAHRRTVQGSTSSASVTAIQWLPAHREHLLLTGSEANASIKLWDTRYVKPRRQAEETPLAVTPEPVTHAWRSYGITSMALGTDASRLYAVCKDSTVYAYSTNHLVLGHAPELLDNATKRKPNGVEGLGPLYGFKHGKFRVSSFYVKCAIRRSSDSNAELLAVGSSDNCAMLFPTDERYMRAAWAQREHMPRDAAGPSQSLSAPPCTPSGPSPSSSPIPIFRGGTPLIRGHGREVTTVVWSHRGELVTASDDFIVRQWQPDADRARYLRQVGEFGGERHLAGWAEVGDDWDVDES